MLERFDKNGNYIDPGARTIVDLADQRRQEAYQRSLAMTPCQGNRHVFACSHTEKCWCGKATQIIEPPKCDGCGRTL